MDTADSEVVRGQDGLRGVIESRSTVDQAATILLDDGRRIVLDSGLLSRRDDGVFDLALGRKDIEAAASEIVVPIFAETTEFARREVETGKVRIVKRVDVRTEVVNPPLFRDEVDVERIPVGTIVDGPVEIRREGDTTIIPLVEEVLVIEKRLLLREELRVTTRKVEFREPKDVEVRSERVIIERVPIDARPTSPVD